VVSCTMLVLVAMLGALCTFSVRVPFSVLPRLARLLRAHGTANALVIIAHWTDLGVKNMHLAEHVPRRVRAIGCNRRWDRRRDVPATLRRRRSAGPYNQHFWQHSWRNNTVWANNHSRVFCAMVWALQKACTRVDPVC
jgi:hypothetical protein